MNHYLFLIIYHIDQDINYTLYNLRGESEKGLSASLLIHLELFRSHPSNYIHL